MNLGLFKFKYGEEIVAEYTEHDDYYFVKNTAGLMATEDFHWQLMTWLPYNKFLKHINIVRCLKANIKKKIQMVHQ